MKRNYYAIAYDSEFAMNDSAEKIKEWGTATIYRFQTKQERDAFVNESHLHDICTAAYARKCGYRK